ncbi:hypothetical protein GIB67_015853 [Kingdonia uniflora]|uniref:DUF4283 domain-containing protein n=1 Tax=Kingdonia uniflora TaxID=39325 RepID=A0A7J7NEV8_9MAGN|nr:hypothetical protein GIB67_015853 [Kingdonia uniflora]
MDLWEMEMTSKVKALYNEKKSTFAYLLKAKPTDLSTLPIPRMRGEFLAIRIPEAGFLRGVERYKFSLIGRLDLMKVKLVVARTKAMSKWSLAGNYQFIPLSKGYFTILLDNESDKLRIWSGGPWHIEVGNPVQVNRSTLCQNTGFYASVLVDVDFSKPIPSKIMVEQEGFEFCQEIQLGKVPKICSHCKVVGHLVSECRDVEKAIEK